jgi:uncharacterized membrane protein
MRSPINDINRLHQFLASQTVYPILLSTLFALALYVARVWQSHSFAYQNLIWNIFLAWIPFWLSIWAAALYTARPGRRWVLILPGFLWLIFFPNAPYLITDFLHLSDRPRIPMWYDILMLATFAWTGCFLAIASLRTMQVIVRHHVGWLLSWAFAGIALGLGGLGIYLGRFSRWNSWDIFISPNEIIYEVVLRVLNPLSNLRFFGFTILFSSFLLICYLMFVTIRKEPQFPN